MNHLIEVSDESFEREVLRATVPVLVDFGATWCAPCRALERVIAQVASERAGTYKFVSVNVDEAPETSKKYGVRGTPTLMVFRDGTRCAVHVGLTTAEKVLRLLEP
jgi:thioredoxin 1